MALAAGVHPKVVQERLGPSNISARTSSAAAVNNPVTSRLIDFSK
jgi:hypothetical protein